MYVHNMVCVYTHSVASALLQLTPVYAIQTYVHTYTCQWTVLQSLHKWLGSLTFVLPHPLTEFQLLHISTPTPHHRYVCTWLCRDVLLVEVSQVTLYLGRLLCYAGAEELFSGCVERGHTGSVGADPRLNVLHTKQKQNLSSKSPQSKVEVWKHNKEVLWADGIGICLHVCMLCDMYIVDCRMGML